MTASVVVRKGAAADLAEARLWYETQSAGLGTEFLDEFASTLARIAEAPLHYPAVHRDARRALFRRFPYSVYFRIRGEEVRIVAVVHQHRDPRVWQRRLRT